MISKMQYYLGIDGGGTKTACMLVDGAGRILAEGVGHGTSYRQYGWEELLAELERLIGSCCLLANIKKESLDGITFGLPCYGENAAMDKKLEDLARQTAGSLKFYLTNDVEVGFAGSLGLHPGIHVVAGTGSIAFGRDEDGKYARCGGWSEHFSDTGSCYWVGKRAMEGFVKEAELVIERGMLYRILRRELSLTNDMDFIEYVEKEVLPFRDKTAAFQKYMLLAAHEGDLFAKSAYEEAAFELFSLILGVKKKLDFKSVPVSVSYSGGLFCAKDYVLPVMKELAGKAGIKLYRPQFSPVQGAVLLAAEKFAPEGLKDIYQTMIQKWKSVKSQ